MNHIKINCIHCWQSTLSFEVDTPEWKAVRCSYCNADLGTIADAIAAASDRVLALAR